MIKKILFLFLLTFNLILSQCVNDYVDLFICTAGDHGQLDPSASVPFGMIKLGPDTDPTNHSGYDYNSNKILGFSHNRIGGVGCSGVGGNLRVLPTIGNYKINSVTFNKLNEKASPNFYSVKLDNNILAELTTTNHTGIHKYTFPKSDSSFLIFDLNSSFADFINSTNKILNKNEFTVTISAMNVCNIGRYSVNYHVWCSKQLNLVNKNNNKLIFQFKTNSNEEVSLYVTASSIDQQDATDEWKFSDKIITFNQALENGQQEWNDLLSRIIVEGKEEYKKLFYTHLYHIFLNPVKTENHLKHFRGTDGEIHTSDNYTHYDTWSMWDNYRNKFSLYSFIIPKISKDICNSLIDLYKYGKPFWSGYNEPAPTVRTEHTIVTLLDLYKRGITDFDIEPMYKKLCAEIENIFENSPDTKLEKSYDYWALSEFAKILNKQDDQKLFLQKAMNYKSTWKDYFLNMDKNADVMHANGLYEGTPWQYRWYVQFDINGLINLFGGKENYTEQLEYFFDNHLYNHGNQPDIHVPFMFNYGTKPWLTQKWVNKILTKKMYQYYGTHEKWEKPYYDKIYKAEPEGYIPEMDDDEGTMSGWFVLSSLGFYPVEVGKPEFQISSPIFDRIILKLENGKTFEIICNNQSEENFYIQSAELNGKEFNQTYIDQSDILKGGKLIYNLSNKPNKNWRLKN